MKQCYFVVIFFTLSTSNSYAYLDPGSASIIIQAVLAALAGALMTAKYWWYRLKALFRRPSKDRDNNEQKDEG